MSPIFYIEGITMCKSIFVTATGTDVGKTFVSGLLVKEMRNYGLNCGYYKPALSGAIRQKDGSLLPGDCDFVLKTSGINDNPMNYVSYCFEEAVSPHLASKRLGVKIDLDVIKKDYSKSQEKFDYLVVEGAGGITCPFDMGENRLLLPDVIKGLGLKAVMVADGGLGTINSVLLTSEYAKAHNIEIVGIILNNYDEEDFMHVDNKHQVEVLTGLKVIATVKKNDSKLNIEKSKLMEIFS